MRRLVAAELAKLRTVWSTVATLVPALVVAVGLAALFGRGWAKAQDRGELMGAFDPLFPAFYGLTLAQLAVVVFGVLAVGSEYGSGMIRASLLAVPRRGRFFAAKVLATAVPMVAVGAAAAAGAFLVSQAALGSYGVSVTSPGAATAIVGAALNVALLGLFAVGVATMLRGSVRTLAILMPLFFLGSQGLGFVPGVREVAQYLPDQVGWVIMHLTQQSDPAFDRPYGPWTGIAILALWAAAALAGGYLVLRRRDA